MKGYFTNKVLMVRPVAFGYNSQTAENNKFQQNGFEEGAQQKALEEFDNYVKELREAGIEVLVVEDTPEPHTPDSIFPNNWFSTHSAEELSSDDAQDERVPLSFTLCLPQTEGKREAKMLWNG